MPTKTAKSTDKKIEILPGVFVEVPFAQFSEREAAALRIPEFILPSQWAEKYRILHEDEADIAGPWDNANAPHLVGIMDMASKPGVRRLTIKKAVQGGISEITRNLMGYWAMMDPAPMGIALPDKTKGEQITNNKIIPFFKRTPVLRKLFSKRATDIKKGELRLANNFLLFLMWSGSPSSLASNPMKRAISDETNKFAKWSADDAGPVELIDRRLTTYADAIHVLISSPTGRDGVISINFDDSDYQFYFCIACPECGTRQRLIWDGVVIPEELLKMADNKEAAKICNIEQPCYYACQKCGHHIDERTRRKLVRNAVWCTVDPENKTFADGVIDDALAIESFPPRTRIGMHISALYWLWESTTLSSIASTFLRAQNNPSRMFDFRTGDLGEDAETSSATVDVNTFSILSNKAELPEAILPDWTDRILMTVDTQMDHFYVVLRAWGCHMLSRRIWHGHAQTFDDLTSLMCRTWAYQSGWHPPIRSEFMLIDSGGTRTDVNPEASSRTQEVYAYVLQYPAQVLPLKGASSPRATRDLFWMGRGLHNPKALNKARRQEVRLLMADTNQAQDILQEMINKQIRMIDPFTGEERQAYQQWGLNTANDSVYNKQMAALAKTMQREGSEMVERWAPIADGARHDYRDCEGYQIHAAYLRGVHLLPSLPTWHQQRKQQVVHSGHQTRIQTPTLPDGRPYFATDRR